MKTRLVCLCLTLVMAPFHVFAGGKALQVVATFSILGDLTKQIGGDLVEVKTLVGPDSDAHTYKPTPDDAKSLAAADLVIENGLGMEGWIDRLVKASGYRGEIVIASVGVTPRYKDAVLEEAAAENDHSQAGKRTDPHAWQNVANTRLYAKNITAALERAMPDQADHLHARAKAYDAELKKLDAWVKTSLAPIPAAQRKIIISHDAFGYFGAAYGVTFIAPQGLSTEVGPTATQAAQLIELIKAEKVKRIFFENMANPKLVQQLAKDTSASIGKPIYSDALSPPDGPAATYTAMVRYNVAEFKAAMRLNGM